MTTTKAVPQSTGALSRVSKYLRGVWSELKKVHWPNRPQLTTYTGVVLMTVIIVGVLIWLMDSVFSLGLGFFL